MTSKHLSTRFGPAASHIAPGLRSHHQTRSARHRSVWYGTVVGPPATEGDTPRRNTGSVFQIKMIPNGHASAKIAAPAAECVRRRDARAQLRDNPAQGTFAFRWEDQFNRSLDPDRGTWSSHEPALNTPYSWARAAPCRPESPEDGELSHCSSARCAGSGRESQRWAGPHLAAPPCSHAGRCWGGGGSRISHTSPGHTR